MAIYFKVSFKNILLEYKPSTLVWLSKPKYSTVQLATDQREERNPYMVFDLAVARYWIILEVAIIFNMWHTLGGLSVQIQLTLHGNLSL